MKMYSFQFTSSIVSLCQNECKKMQKRINKYLSESGYCSRREADKYIEQACVTIDGILAEKGSKVNEGQEVRVNGEIVKNNILPIIIAYNKPVGIVSTTDPKEPKNIVNAIGHSQRIFPIGRLDKDSQGLLLLTNEGDIVNKILRVNNNHDKEYYVRVDKPITDHFIQKMQNGVPILGVVTLKCELVKHDDYSFNIILHQGLNRQIRRMCDYLGYKVVKLERIRVMHIKLGDLKLGKWRNLSQEETELLYKKLATSVKTEEASVLNSKESNRPKQTQKGVKKRVISLGKTKNTKKDSLNKNP